MTFNRPLGRFLFVFTLLLVMLGSTLLSLWIRNDRDRRAWEACRRELEAVGERLDWREYVPPAVPDEQNFAMTPLLAPLQDCATDAAGQLTPRDPNAITRLRETFVWAGQMRGGDWQRMTFADIASWQRW